VEAKTALQKSYKKFMDGVDPANIVTPLFTEELLTKEEREKSTLQTRTENQQLQEIYVALERRVSANPQYFHTLVEILQSVPALKDVGDHMKGIFDKECGRLTANAGQLPQPIPQPKPTIPLLKRLPTQSGGGSWELGGHHNPGPLSLLY
jgi:hypothetical protein